MNPRVSIHDLSPDQRVAYDRIIDWTRDQRGVEVMTCGGYAGSGKSTLVSLVAAQLPPPVAFVAYTGKASSVLGRKLREAGVYTVGPLRKNKDGTPSDDRRPFCGTIHSLIYGMCECRDPIEAMVDKPCPVRDCDSDTSWTDGVSRCRNGHTGVIETRAAWDALQSKMALIYPPKIDGICSVCKDEGWTRRETLDRDYSLIIVDEASMVNSKMLGDLCGYGIPILAVGDHGQLPPVSGDGTVMQSPIVRLEKIHRQAEKSPIIALSKIIRETGRLPDQPPNGDAVRYCSIRFLEELLRDRYAGASPERLLDMGLVCYTNWRRQYLNRLVRKIRRNKDDLGRAGDHVVCLRNMRGIGFQPVANGMRGVLLSDVVAKEYVDHKNQKTVDEHVVVGSIEFPEDGIKPREYNMLRHQFGRERTYKDVRELQQETSMTSFDNASLFDFGWAMTCHKMQGSQIKDLVVVAERPGPCSNEDWKRWLYTATTRAAERLTIVKA